MRVSLPSAALLAVALFAVSPAAHAVDSADGPGLLVTPQTRSDAELAADVRRAILDYPDTTVFDNYAFSVERGVVTLLGSVQRPHRKAAVARRVARVEGVRGVDNRIEVQPPSSFDDEVRLKLARAIYGGDRFPHYGLGPNPSVRILVAGGRVTLAGVVSSRLDQVQLGFIARSIAPFGVDNQLVVEGEVPKERSGARSERI